MFDALPHPHRVPRPPRRLAAWFIALFMALLQAACGGGGNPIENAVDDAIAHALDFEGEFEASDGLVIGFDPESGIGKVIAFGESLLGTNTGLLKTGDTVVQNFEKHADGTYSADVFVGSYTNGPSGAVLSGGSFQRVNLDMSSGVPEFSGDFAPYDGEWQIYDPTAGNPDPNAGTDTDPGTCDGTVTTLTSEADTWTLTNTTHNIVSDYTVLEVTSYRHAYGSVCTYWLEVELQKQANGELISAIVAVGEKPTGNRTFATIESPMWRDIHGVDQASASMGDWWSEAEKGGAVNATAASGEITVTGVDVPVYFRPYNGDIVGTLNFRLSGR